MTAPRLPRQLTEKYHDLMRERAQRLASVEELDRELAALEYAIRVVDPEWKPPTRPKKEQRPSRLPVGVLARDCVAALKQQGELWTPEVGALVAARRQIQFANRKEQLDFASSVAMSLRRYERQGFLEIVDRNTKTQALKWRIRKDGPAHTDGDIQM
jgi:hypothetical protein